MTMLRGHVLLYNVYAGFKGSHEGCFAVGWWRGLMSRYPINISYLTISLSDSVQPAATYLTSLWRSCGA